jgi:transposase
MRGQVDSQGEIYHTFDVEDLIPAAHPLREITRRADRVLAGMSAGFDAASGSTGRPGIPPERLIRALLLQSLYSIRSEIQLCEQISYHLLFRWFLDMQPSESVWTPEAFSMNRQRCADHGFVRTFFEHVVDNAMLDDVKRRRVRSWPKSLGGDGSYAAGAFLREVERRGVTPYVPIPQGRIGGDHPEAEARREARRRMGTAAYRLVHQTRKRAEDIIGWCKTIGGLARTRFVGRWKIALETTITASAYHLLRLARTGRAVAQEGSGKACLPHEPGPHPQPECSLPSCRRDSISQKTHPSK